MMKIDLQIYALAEQRRRRCLRVGTIALLLAGLSACSEPPYSNVDNTQLQIMLEQNIPIYDIRRPEEWQQTGVIEDSTLLTFTDGNGRVRPDFIRRFTAAIEKHDPVILICRTSTLARYLVEEMDYTQVFNVRHGITHWLRDNKPVKRL